MDDQITLRPDAGTALTWSFASIALLSFGVWFVLDSGGSPFMWSAFGLMLAVSSYFLLQLAFPGWFELHVDQSGVRARTAWQHLDVQWENVRSASIREFAGEPYLYLSVIEEVAGGWVVNPTAVLLPLGADTAALRFQIARARARRDLEA